MRIGVKPEKLECKSYPSMLVHHELLIPVYSTFWLDVMRVSLRRCSMLCDNSRLTYAVRHTPNFADGQSSRCMSVNLNQTVRQGRKVSHGRSVDRCTAPIGAASGFPAHEPPSRFCPLSSHRPSAPTILSLPTLDSPNLNMQDRAAARSVHEQAA